MISVTKLLKAIRKNCLRCSGGDRAEVSNCSMTDCSLYPYRMGLQVEGTKKDLGRQCHLKGNFENNIHLIKKGDEEKE